MSKSALYIGLDIGEALIKSALTDGQGGILEIEQQATPAEDPAALQQATVAIVQHLQEQAARRGGQVAAVGVGLPGVVDPPSGRVVMSPNLRILTEMDLRHAVSASTHLPVVVEHRAKMAAYGEYVCGAARGMENVLYVELGDTIGSGIISTGRLYRGSLGYSGELGHMTVDPDGLECTCGNIGCLETIASGPNLVRRTKERLFRDRSSSLSSLTLPGKGELTPQRIAMEALNGDDFSLMMLEQTGKWLGMALANVINLLNLDMVILDGAVMVAGELLLQPIVKGVRERALEAPGNHCRIVTSVLGGQAGLLGATMLARDMVERQTI